LVIFSWRRSQRAQPRKSRQKTGDIEIEPINHATFVLAGTARPFSLILLAACRSSTGKPDLILVTNIPGDHLNADTLKGVRWRQNQNILSRRRLPKNSPPNSIKTETLANGATKDLDGISIEAIPMYILTPERQQYTRQGTAATATSSPSAANASTSAATRKTFPKCAPSQKLRRRLRLHEPPLHHDR
jgi:hypothetical protein